MVRKYSEAEIVDNTELVSLDLVPEIPVRLLRLNGPWSADDSGALGEKTFPHWAFAWASGQAITRYLLTHPEFVAGKNVVDFGAGCGLASVAAARCGAHRVIACDIDPNALTACRLNAALNRVKIETVLGDAKTLDLPDCEVLIASDVFFHWKENNELLTTDPGVSEILVAVPHKRGFSPNSELPMDVLEKLDEYEVKTVPAIERADIKRVAVYRRRTLP